MNKKVTPISLSEYWGSQHINKGDIESMLKHVDEQIEKISPSISTPTILHMIGAPGSGKTTLVKAILEQMDKRGDLNFYHLGFDRIMESFNLYKKDVSDLGILKSFQRWELPARVAGYALLDNLIQRKISLIFDHTASDPRHFELLKTIQNTHGYRVIMIHSKTSLETAIQRADERNQKGIRFTSKEMITERYNILLNLIDQYNKNFTVIEIENEGVLQEKEIEKLINILK